MHRFPYHVLKNVFHTGLDLRCLSKIPKATFCKSSWQLPMLNLLRSNISIFDSLLPHFSGTRLTLKQAASLSPKARPCETEVWLWCRAIAVPSTHLCTRRVVGNDLEMEFCQVHEIRDIKKYHGSRDLENMCGGVRSRALNQVSTSL